MQVCKVKHGPSSFYKSYVPSFYHVILLQCVWCRKVVIDSLGHQIVIQKSIVNSIPLSLRIFLMGNLFCNFIFLMKLIKVCGFSYFSLKKNTVVKQV